MYNNLSIEDVFELMRNNVDVEKLINKMEDMEFFKRDYDDRRVMAFVAMIQFIILLKRSPLTIGMSISEDSVETILMLLFNYVRGVLS